MFPDSDHTLQQRLTELEAVVARQDERLRERGAHGRRLEGLIESYRGQARLACAQAGELRDQLAVSRQQFRILTSRLADVEAAAAAAALRASERVSDLASQLEQARIEHRQALDDVARGEEAFSNAIAALDGQM